jgi:hypothetical protein
MEKKLLKPVYHRGQKLPGLTSEEQKNFSNTGQGTCLTTEIDSKSNGVIFLVKLNISLIVIANLMSSTNTYPASHFIISEDSCQNVSSK